MTFCFCAGNDTNFFPFSGHFLCKFLCVIERHGRSIRLSECIHNKKAAKTSRFVLATATALFAPVQFLAGAWPQSGLAKPMYRSQLRALLSGVYGMNFAVNGDPTIPELKWEYGNTAA